MSAPLRVMGWPAFASRQTNPYTALLYESVQREGVSVSDFNARRLLREGTDILHIHWADALVDRPGITATAARAVALLAIMSLVRARGGKVIWTVHNLSSHDGSHPRLEAWFWRRFVKRLSGYFALSEYGRAAAAEHFRPLRNLPAMVVPHGDYRAEYPRGVAAPSARARLGVTAAAQVVLFFGRVRPYKGVLELIEAFSALDGDHLVLCVAGAPSSDELGAELRAAAARDSRIRAQLRFVPADEAQVFFAAADLVVLPYVNVLNSGSALLALSFDRPVLLPGRGTMVELQNQVGEEWVRTFEGALTPSELRAAIDWAAGATRPRAAPLEQFSWDGLGRRTARFYEQVLRGRHEVDE